MKKLLQNSITLFAFIIVANNITAQTADSLLTSFDQNIAQQEMLFKDCNTNIAELKALYKVDLTDFEKEDLTDKIWYYELKREVVELKIKFLKKEAAYANGTLSRPLYTQNTKATAFVEEIKTDLPEN